MQPCYFLVLVYIFSNLQQPKVLSTLIIRVYTCSLYIQK